MIKLVCGRKKIRNTKSKLNLENSQNSPFIKNEFMDKSKANMKAFLENTSLHGLKYLADDTLSLFERAFFSIAFLSVIGFSGYFINNVYLKWSSHPIIISSNPNPTYTTSIPFPAITICNLNEARRSRAELIKSGTNNASLLLSLCSGGRSVTKPMSSYSGSWASFKPILMDVAQPCHDMLLHCEFGSSKANCSKIFEPTLTDAGLCCTFNAVADIFLQKNYSIFEQFDDLEHVNITPIDWTPEKGYPKDLEKIKHFYPRIAKGTGRHMGLTVILNTSKSEYYCSSEKGYGFKILVHSPMEQPKVSKFGSLINSGVETRIGVIPKLSTASPLARKIDAKIRQCLFSDEGNLTYYRTYSLTNCELECEAKYLAQECGCVPYYLPRISSTIRICGIHDFNCIKKTQKLLESYTNTKISCENCYPGCFELSFATTISFIESIDGDFESQTDSYLTEYYIKKEVINTTNIDEITIIHFFYENNFFRSETVDVIIGFTDFLSNVGGLLGLFMGFSIFSAIEIFYFFCLKPLFVYKKYQNTKAKKLGEQIEKKLEISKLYESILTSYESGIEKEDNWNSLKYDGCFKEKISTAFQAFLDKIKKSDQVYPYCE